METKTKKVSISELIKKNPTGLFELKKSLTIEEYINNYGFNLRKTLAIYKSRRLMESKEDWFAGEKSNLKDLFKVQKDANGEVLMIYIVETMELGRIHCYLVLSDEAFQRIVDEDIYLLQVHQMYAKFWQDYIQIDVES